MAKTVQKITTTKAPLSLGLRDLIAYRSLIYFFAWRDISVRYKQTIFGVGWALLQPVATMLIFTLVFGRVAKIDSQGVPYPLFSYSALIPWTFFATSLDKSSASLVGNANLLQKIYFPRMVSPISAVVSSLFDFFITFSVLAVLMFYYGYTLTWRVLLLLPLTGLSFATALAIGLWLSALNVRFRDVRYTIPFLIQLWLLATPVAYPSGLIDPRFQLAYSLNPMVGVVEGFRWALLDVGPAPTTKLLTSVILVLLLLIGGALFFAREERVFADIV